MNPKISVLIPAYNAEKTILAAVWSALNQHFDGFEVCVYNDGSTDKTQELLDDIADARLRVFNADVNKGVVFARNCLLQKTTTPFVAWLDADDIMLPGRLQAQYHYFQKHPKTDILGGWAELRNFWEKEVSHHRKHLVKAPLNPDYLETAMLFKNPMINSSVMSRHFFVSENLLFDSAFEGFAEDYDLFLRCRNKGKRFGIIPQPMVSYWVREAGEQARIEQERHADEKRAALLCRNFPFTQTEIASDIIGFLRTSQPISERLFLVLLGWLKQAKKQLNAGSRLTTTGAKAALMLHFFRLYRLRFGLLPAAMWLLVQNPFTVVTMLRNRTRIV